MPVIMPEKSIVAVLASGLTEIKQNPALYLPDIFDEEVLGQSYIDNVSEFLTSRKITIKEAYPMSEEETPGWFVIPASSQAGDAFIGDLLETDKVIEGELDSTDYAYDVGAIYNSHNVRILTASLNIEVTKFLNAIGRYLLLLAKDDLGEHGLLEIMVTALDFDPVYQYLPDTMYYRTAMINCKAMDTWTKRMALLQHITVFMSAHLNERGPEEDRWSHIITI